MPSPAAPAAHSKPSGAGPPGDQVGCLLNGSPAADQPVIFQHDRLGVVGQMPQDLLRQGQARFPVGHERGGETCELIRSRRSALR